MQTVVHEGSLPSFCPHDSSLRISPDYRAREAAEETFWQWLEQAVRHSQRKLLLVQGPPGSGKSWLSAYLAVQVTRQAQERGLSPLEGVYLPWPLEDKADMATFFQKHLRLPPRPKDVRPEAWIREALTQHLQTSRRRFVLFVDNLDRLPKARVEAIERRWLRNLAPMDLSVWLVLVHFGPLHDPELRLRGASTLRLGAFRAAEELLRGHYQRRWQPTEEASEPAYDFRYPLVNAWLRHEANEQRGDGEGMPVTFWRRGLACLLCRRPATRPWAQGLLSGQPLVSVSSLSSSGERLSTANPSRTPSSVFPFHTLYEIFGKPPRSQPWEPPSDAAGEVYRLPYAAIQRETWWTVLDELHAADFLHDEVVAYTMDASLWRFWHDALRQLALGETYQGG